MLIGNSPVVFIGVLISVLPLSSQMCQNVFGDYQEILQSRQEPGKFRPNAGMRLFKQCVFTKMQCLDICLRTAECGSFDMKQRYSKDNTTILWSCIINRRVHPQRNVSELALKNKSAWMHFNVSSKELQEVSYFR